MKMRYFNKFNKGTTDFVTPGKQIEYIAMDKPDEPAITYIDKDDKVREITWMELNLLTNRLANYLLKKGIGPGDVVLISYPNSIEHIAVCLATWKAGACYMPISYKTTCAELKEIYDCIIPKMCFSDIELYSQVETIRFGQVMKIAENESSEAPMDVYANPNMISPTGGTTGKNKFVKQNIASGCNDKILQDWVEMSGMKFDQRQLLVGPLQHGAPHTACFNGLFMGNQIIIARNLSADNILRLIKVYRIQFMQMVPTLMNRILKLEGLKKEDLASLESINHTGGNCSSHVKQKWIDLIGPEKVFEMYSMTEAIGLTSIRGDEWLKHYGSVGKPLGDSKVSIRNLKGEELGPLEIGEIYMTPISKTLITEYINEKPLKNYGNEFRSVGDIGYLDEDGYLYFLDRRNDMVVIGGENVYVSEIETVLLGHEDVIDAVVIGVHDDEMGRCLHVIVETRKTVTKEELIDYMKKYLLPYKIPRSFEFVSCIPRNESGKINRTYFIKKYCDSSEDTGKCMLKSTHLSMKEIIEKQKKKKKIGGFNYEL